MSGLQPQNFKRRRYITTCPLCKRAIFEGDATRRVGLAPVHKECPA